MLELVNPSPFPAHLFPVLDKAGGEHLVAAVKATFTLDKGQLRIAEEQVPLTLADEHHGDPATTSIRYQSDLCPPKLGTDVVLCGSAHSAQPVKSIDVGMAVGTLRKTFRVFGERAWYKRVLSWQITNPMPFRQMPLLYERAFGGADTIPKDKAKHDFEPRNPIGTGFVGAGKAERIEMLRLPNLEDPLDLIASPSDKPTPVGVGFVGRSWTPRAALAGTYDERWKQERSPLLPLDFNEAYFSGASTGLMARPHLVGGEEVRLLNCSPDGTTVGFNLPKVKVDVSAVVKGQKTQVPSAVLDTVIIEPDARRVLLTWHAALSCTRNLLHVEKVTLAVQS